MPIVEKKEITLGKLPNRALIEGNFSQLIFKAVDVRGLGPALNEGDKKNKINVIPSIFVKF